jgi:hypothetical protein
MKENHLPVEEGTGQFIDCGLAFGRRGRRLAVVFTGAQCACARKHI